MHWINKCFLGGHIKSNFLSTNLNIYSPLIMKKWSYSLCTSVYFWTMHLSLCAVLYYLKCLEQYGCIHTFHPKNYPWAEMKRQIISKFGKLRDKVAGFSNFFKSFFLLFMCKIIMVITDEIIRGVKYAMEFLFSKI